MMAGILPPPATTLPLTKEDSLWYAVKHAKVPSVPWIWLPPSHRLDRGLEEELKEDEGI